jgi:two-component system, NtrC family, sensor histidine kinase HydH
VSSRRKYIIVLTIIVPITLAFHFYSQLWQAPSGQSSFMRYVLSDLCYIPIVLSAVWFGLGGAIPTASFLAIASFLFIIFIPPQTQHELISDYFEILFFCLVGGIAGAVVDRDKRLRRSLEVTQRNLHQTERLSIIGQMVASVVHEIKNPLISIMGAANILRDRSVSAEQRDEYITVIENEAKRLNDTICLLLSYPKPGPPNLTDIDIKEALDTIQKQLEFQCRVQGIKLSIRCSDIPLIKGDHDKLYHAFSNIVINAMQAMPQGGKIDLNCYRFSNSIKNSVVIEISDNGPGIPKEILPKVFQPFFTTKNTGTGLGLAITQGIVREHSGTIKIESADKVGTKFIITLPAIS